MRGLVCVWEGGEDRKAWINKQRSRRKHNVNIYVFHEYLKATVSFSERVQKQAAQGRAMRMHHSPPHYSPAKQSTVHHSTVQ